MKNYFYGAKKGDLLSLN